MSEPFLPPVKKFDIKDANPCEGCSNCCEYLAIEIDNPTTVTDFEQILWYVIHKNIWVYVCHDNEWHIQFNTPCEKLVDRRCTFYVNRPSICRDYEPVSCPRYDGEPAEKYIFKNEHDLFAYLAKRRPKTFEKLRFNINLAEYPPKLIKV